MRRIGRCAELGYMAVYTAIINYPFIPAMGRYLCATSEHSCQIAHLLRSLTRFSLLADQQITY